MEFGGGGPGGGGGAGADEDIASLYTVVMMTYYSKHVQHKICNTDI